MLTELRLNNFQGFGGETKARLAPITIIFGPNSSGKSSLIRSLLLLKQASLDNFSEDNQFPFVGDHVDLGSFDLAVHRHDTEKNISIGITDSHSSDSRSGFEIVLSSGRGIEAFIWSGIRPLSNTLSMRNALGDKSPEALPSLNLTFDASSDSPGVFYFSAKNDTEVLFRDFQNWVSTNIRAKDSPFITLELVDFQQLLLKMRFNRRGMSLEFRDRFRALEEARIQQKSETASEQENDTAIRFIADFLDTLLTRHHYLSMRHRLAGMRHLKGLRSVPDRLINAGQKSSIVSPSGDNLLAVFNARGNVFEASKKWMQRLTNDQYALDLLELEARNNDMAVVGKFAMLQLRDLRLNVEVSFKDVGTGLSQVLPVIATLVNELGRREESKNPLFAPRLGGNPVLIEQPELHLHPRMQAELADLFIETSAARNKSNPQVIVETHSENMILRIQKRVREGVIQADQVSIIYVNKNEDGVSQLKHLDLGSNGDFVADWAEVAEFGNLRMQEFLD